METRVGHNQPQLDILDLDNTGSPSEKTSVTRKHSIKDFQETLNLKISSQLIHEKHPSNGVRTSRYTILSWAPKSLIWQFRRVANLYFLVISVLTAMPFSPKAAFSMASTFAAVLFFSMLKEAYEDYFRHKQDNSVNKAITHKVDFDKMEVVDIKTQEVRVGDVVMVKESEVFPADLLFLSGSNPKGLAFVNTMNLDGETNLKEKIASEMTKSFDNVAALKDLQGELSCDLPNKNLVKWNCKVKVGSNPWEPLSINQLLLRGCMLKNTDYVYGFVVYTGQNSKIMLNSKKAPSKVSNILKKMNKILYSFFVFQLFICITFAALNTAWTASNSSDHLYLDQNSEANFGSFILQILTYWVAYSHLIPISLYVALEVVKLMIAYLISKDLDMYYGVDDKPADSRNSDLVEELGQVEFVFSDKTGTLTSNIMEFKKFFVDGVSYEVGHFESAKNQKLRNFFLHMGVCHSVFPTKDKKDPSKINYQAASPDELALVEGAALGGIKFFERSEGKVYLTNNESQTEEWEILEEIPFNSDRKRMSVIARDPRTKELVLFTKGADSVMLELIENKSKREIETQLYNYAVEALRTLVMAMRVVPEKEFAQWQSEWKRIQLSNSESKEQELDKQGALIEKNLEFVGISAIEDKLQEGVPKTIKLLMDAGIRVWVLTGDKEETAIEIGKSCNLIQKESQMRLIQLSSNTKEEIEEKLRKYEFEFNLSNSSFEALETQKSTLEKKLAIVVDGLTLIWILENPNALLKQVFFKLGFLSDSCICCRVSPAQKMQVVHLAKQNGPWITLSIGDGANDVSMIQEAHIGIGIAGKEGTQAMQSSDFALAQFRFLGKLLLVHGRWGYRRISWFICYYFYKNITVVFTELWFSVFNGFSGQIYFLDWLPMLYNALWTSWPCLVTYLFEQDLKSEESMKNPEAYKAGQKGVYFNYKRFWIWVVFAIWHGVVCYWGPVAGHYSAVDSSGKDTGLWWVSTLSFTVIIHVVTYKLLLESFYWTSIGLGIGFLSIVFYYISVIVLCTQGVSDMFQPQAYELFTTMLGNGKAWITIFLGPFVALLPDFLFQAFRFLYFPNPTESLMKQRTHSVKPLIQSLS